MQRCHEYTNLSHGSVHWLTWQIFNPQEGMFSPTVCSFTWLYWVKRGHVICWDCLPYFLGSRAICVSCRLHKAWQIRHLHKACSFLSIVSVCSNFIFLPSVVFSRTNFFHHVCLSFQLFPVMYTPPLLLSSPTADRSDPAWWWHFTHADLSQLTRPCGSQIQGQGQAFCCGKGRVRPARWP